MIKQSTPESARLVVDSMELGYRQHLSFGGFVGSSPYPTWCKDYSDPDRPFMLWISRSYEDIFNVDHKVYEGQSDRASGYWSEEVCAAFEKNDHTSMSLGMYTTVEHIGTGIPNWDDAIVTKWTTKTEHSGEKLVFVYGLAVPLNGRSPQRVRAELRNQATPAGYTVTESRV